MEKNVRHQVATPHKRLRLHFQRFNTWDFFGKPILSTLTSRIFTSTRAILRKHNLDYVYTPAKPSFVFTTAVTTGRHVAKKMQFRRHGYLAPLLLESENLIEPEPSEVCCLVTPELCIVCYFSVCLSLREIFSS